MTDCIPCIYRGIHTLRIFYTVTALTLSSQLLFSVHLAVFSFSVFLLTTIKNGNRFSLAHDVVIVAFFSVCGIRVVIVSLSSLDLGLFFIQRSISRAVFLSFFFFLSLQCPLVNLAHSSFIALSSLHSYSLSSPLLSIHVISVFLFV